MSAFEESKGSPLNSNSLKSSDNSNNLQVKSGSTANLERAYEDLEREIMDIKRKLQSSVNLNQSSSNANVGEQTTDSRPFAASMPIH